MERGRDEVQQWRKKYEDLEASLHRFRQQASTIKQSVGKEMKDLERRKTEAELRADAAEEKLRVMEQQLAAVNWKPDDFEKHIRDLEQQCRDKDANIQELQAHVEEQRQLRQHDARSVEEKAAKIKEWVIGKLSQLEIQNHELTLKNEVLTEQVDTLRQRLHSLPVKELNTYIGSVSRVSQQAKHIHRVSQQESTDSPPIPSSLTVSPCGTMTTKSKRSQPHSQSILSESIKDSTTQGIMGDISDKEDLDTFDDTSRPISLLSSSVSNSRLKDLGSRPVSNLTGSRPGSEFTTSSRPESQSTYSKPHKRPSSSIIEALEIENELFNYGLDQARRDSIEDRDSPEIDIDYQVSGNVSDDSMNDIDFDPHYQEVDQNHESTYEPKKSGPPQIRIERKIFQERMDSFVSSSNDSEDMLERTQRVPIYATIDKPTMPVEPMSRSVEFEPTARSSGFTRSQENIISPIHSSPVTLTPCSPRSPLSPLTPQLPDLVSTPTMQQRHQHLSTSSSNTVSAVATLPRRPPRDRSKPPPVHFDFEDSVISRLDRPRQVDSQVVSAEVHSAPATVSRQQSKPQPPQAPRGRFNTWGTKAYHTIHRDRRRTENASAKDLFGNDTVPVYATLKGKAMQIRSTPFTEESAESSEDDGTSDVEGAPATPRTIARRQQQVNQSSSGATKRGMGVGRHSVSSEVSGDYANPPDNVSLSSDSDTSEPEQKLLKYEENKHDTLDKCGYLSKLGGKVKTWKKRWFVLRGSELFYYKSQHDMLKKPQGCIKFDILHDKRTYYLSADTYTETDDGMLQKVLKRQATSYLLDQVETRAVIKGFLTKVKNGITRKCWCVLLGGYFLYYRSPSNKTPFGQIDLQGARLEEIDTPTESEEESDVAMPTKHVIAIWPPCQGPTYLIVPTKQEKESWLYHLTVAAGGGTGNVGTQFEQFIAKLMQVEGDPNCVYWKYPVLLHSKEPVSTPLTTLPSKYLQKHAVQMFQTVHQFMCTMIESHSLEVHVSLAQSILHQCIQQPQLQNELYCQLIKQTSRHPVQNRSTVQNLFLCGKHTWYLCHTSPTSPSNSVLDLTAESKMNPQSFVIVQGWQLLAMCISLFIPKQSIMWLLKMHLQRNADPRTDIGKYAIFCQRALERSQQQGLREVKPSRMEVMSILLRHPYHHSQPISIPVHFLNNNYQVISFDGSTTIQEFLQSINKCLAVQDCTHSGFALFSDDPLDPDIETCLQNHIKICDVISKWEECFREYHGGKLDTSRTIRLLYKNRLYYKSTRHFETDREKLLLTYQINDEIVNGRFPLNRDLALELASLMAQIEYGDLKSGDSSLNQQVSQILERFYPRKYREAASSEGTRGLQEKLIERWTSLRGRTHQDCVRVYLAVAHKWQFCGAKLFLTRERESTSPDEIWLAIQEEGVAVLEYSTMQPIGIYDYRSVVTFGGWNEDLMVVVNKLIESAPHHYEHRTQKLLFILPKHKVLEATQLIASYINARVNRQSQEPNGGVTM
ncbi:pleckstrin homology domain-containing family H member 1-like [Mercenaria mercenaria]|uniref:pleckstrin homology domain-containing family H member 1-like n=1 Tax=Mercenaria mercenaria TaxID=6596 RepID=UPI00234FB11B|nr:pleckstrin homology domain-containing family H member 1-like [Mercenaria mercenaria]